MRIFTVARETYLNIYKQFNNDQFDVMFGFLCISGMLGEDYLKQEIWRNQLDLQNALVFYSLGYILLLPW